MNRHQRRAARRERQDGLSLFMPCNREVVTAAIARAEHIGQPGLATLLREMITTGLRLAFVEQRSAIISPHDLDRPVGPVLVVVADDDYSATGPAGWRCAEAIAAWAKFATIHAAGADSDTYRLAAEGALQCGSAALIETDSQNAAAWAHLFVGKPGLMIMPRKGVHPMRPVRSMMQ